MTKTQNVAAVHCQRVVDSETEEAVNEVFATISEENQSELCFDFKVLEVENCLEDKGEIFEDISIFTVPSLPRLVIDRFRITPGDVE